MSSKEEENKSPNIEDENDISAPKTMRLSRWMRFGIYAIFWAIHFFNCSDGGVPSASSVNIKKDLGFSDSAFGRYGSIVQIGRITGTLIVMSLLNICNRKYLIITALFFKCASFLIYLVTYNIYIIYVFRYIQGVTHVFTYVYFPTWIDQYGMQAWKPIMMSMIQTASPFGSVFGFTVTTYIGTERWYLGFATLAFLILPLNVILLFVPETYFSNKIFFLKEVKENEPERKDKKNRAVYSLFEMGAAKELKNKNKSLLSAIGGLFNGVYLFIVLARTVLMFIFMAIHYWIGDYFTNVLEIKDKLARTSSYSFVSLAGPFIGSTVGAAVCQFFGGYEKKSSIFVCILFSVLTGISAAAVPYTQTIFYFSVALFMFFLFANCQMPILIGISFSSVSKELKPSSYGVNSLMCTFLGNLLAPATYGMLNDYFKATDKRLAMKIVLNYSWVNLVYLILCAIFRYRSSAEDEDEKNKPLKPNEGTELEEK
jgi:MFS family permease